MYCMVRQAVVDKIHEPVRNRTDKYQYHYRDKLFLYRVKIHAARALYVIYRTSDNYRYI